MFEELVPVAIGSVYWCNTMCLVDQLHPTASMNQHLLLDTALLTEASNHVCLSLLQTTPRSLLRSQ